MPDPSPALSVTVNRLIRRAMLEAESCRANEVTFDHLLISILGGVLIWILILEPRSIGIFD
jgi:hypothetical protein